MSRAAAVLFSALMALALALASWDRAAAQPEGNVSVEGIYLTDSDGYNYGVNWYLNSSVNSVVCVFPNVIEAQNVTGQITEGPVLLQPYEKNVNIGQHISADRSQPWRSNVGAKWKEGDQCI
jgi:hypothetical protein